MNNHQKHRIIGLTTVILTFFLLISVTVIPITAEKKDKETRSNGYEWDKSSIEVTGYCDEENGLAVFTITNTGEPGEGDMMYPSEYRVYRNGELEDTQSFQLAGGESLEVEVEADCDTIRLEADQSPGHPGHSQPRETIEDCGCTE